MGGNRYVKYEIKKILGNKFVPIFLLILFAISLFLSHYAVPRSMEELNLHTDVDEEVQAIIDDLFARYEADPDTFMAEFMDYRACYEKYNEVSSLVREKITRLK